MLDAPARRAHMPVMTPDPFVRPEDPTAADAIAEIAASLDVFDDWMDRYQWIIELGRKRLEGPPCDFDDIVTAFWSN